MTTGRFLGIDYGTKRIGVALSDEEGKLAFPKEIVLNDTDTFKRLGEIIKTERVAEIVVGESTNFAGEENKIGREIESFLAELKARFQTPVHKQKEFLTSVEARRYQEGSKNSVDSAAAALILQRYLDKIRK